MIGRMRMWLCAIAMLLLATVDATAADVRAWLDRNAMQLGETVTLNVEVSGSTTASEPDLSVLQQDFMMSGTQSSSSVNIVNGQATSKLLWAVALEPKRVGTFTIPALSVAGQSTQPITLTVQASAAFNGKVGDDVYIETTVEPRSPYVQQEVSMTVKLFFAVNLIDGALDDPQADGLVVHKIGGQDANFSADVGGRRYRVLERRYVLQSEKSGAITVPAIAFRGHAMDRSDMNSFFSRGRNVSAHADAITLDVKPKPASAGNDAWLPAQSVTLTADGVDANKTARVGEPITLTLRLQAQGLGFEQLPELKLPPIDGADIYPDKASTQNRDTGDVITGERERKFAIVPNRSGKLTIPAISIGWWDTTHDRAATTTTAQTVLDVEAAAGSAPSVPPTPSASATEKPVAAAPPPMDAMTPAKSDDSTHYWQVISATVVVLWLLTIGAWIVSNTRRNKIAPISTDDLAQGSANATATSVSLRAACASRDWAAVSKLLLESARKKKPAIRNLREMSALLGDPQQVQTSRADSVLSALLGDPQQVRALDDLERVRYGGADVPDLGGRIASVFKNGPRFADAKSIRNDPTGILPPLYPTSR